MKSTEFKIKYPQFAHLEGEALWSAMENQFISEHQIEPVNLDEDGIEHFKKHFCIPEAELGRSFKNFGMLVPAGVTTDLSGQPYRPKKEFEYSPPKICIMQQQEAIDILIKKLTIENLGNDTVVTSYHSDGKIREKFFPLEEPIENILADIEKGQEDWELREMNGAEEITEERQEQIVKHGFIDDVDDGHTLGELSQAAKFIITGDQNYAPANERRFWMGVFEKKNHLGRLRVAASLIAAEIDRLKRIDNKNKKPDVETEQ